MADSPATLKEVLITQEQIVACLFFHTYYKDLTLANIAIATFDRELSKLDGAQRL